MIKAVKGTRDILPPSSTAWNQVEAIAREVFRVYNYQEIRTPILEETALFARGVGQETDIVSKEMYTFDDRDGSSLTLRPEATASVMRAYIEHRLDQKPGLQKLYYIGPMFRRERPQKGRYRQFYQIGAEAIGSESPTVDAEVIEMVIDLLRRAGLEGFQLLINSVGDQNCRPQYVALIKERLADVVSRLCDDCQRRAETNPLRVLDCKVPEDQPIDRCSTHRFRIICASLAAGILTRSARIWMIAESAYEVRPRMVRGLDYYMRTTFEIVHGSLGAQNSVLGGGRYDGLAESFGSRVHSPGIGFSIGEDRLVMSLEQTALSKEDPLVMVTFTAGDATQRAAANAAAELRAQGIRVEVAEGKLKKVFEIANKLNARVAIICGENETAAGEISMKDMENQVQVQLRRELLVEKVKECLSKYL